MNKYHSYKRLTIALIAVVMITATTGLAGKAQAQSARPGLLILSHGAPSEKWNQPVNALVERVRKENNKEKRFHAVEGSFLEFAQPDAAAGIEKLEAAGCDHIIVVPFFIAPSSHSHFDVPAVLGLYSSPAIRAVLTHEGARVAKPKVPITMTQTLSEGDLLERCVLDAIKALSKSPQDEAVVLLAHGCPDHHQLVDRMMRRVATHCCGKAGLDYADWAYCAVGQTFWEEAAPAIARAAENKKHVLVVGLYVSSSAKRLYERAIKTAQGPMGTEFSNPLDGLDLVFSDKGVVDHPDTPRWILEAAASVIGHVSEAQ